VNSELMVVTYVAWGGGFSRLQLVDMPKNRNK